MYILASNLRNLPIISLQTGEAIGSSHRPVIDIATFEIVAFRCESARGRRPLILLSRDIRQLATDCMIIDNEEELTEPEDIIRLKGLLGTDYTPLEKAVVADTGRKLGQVEDYSINLETCRIQKLYVRGSLFRAWLGSSLIIDRTQIIDITPKRITVRDSIVKSPILPTDAIPEVSP
ncbi:MAG: hypothetical protein JWN01_1026 [Patescibacteria group bacterium]|nr:hypothetical protein [Patescibacteria group bacterium]